MRKLREAKKITIATVKSFIQRNREDLYINVRSEFDGMTDGIESRHDGFRPAQWVTQSPQNDFGVGGAWFVGSSRDSLRLYEDDTYVGIEVYNACGSFILAVQK